MNNLKNQVRLMGHVAQAPELKTFSNGKKLALFAMATNDYFTQNGRSKSVKTQWHQISAWGKQAENTLHYVKKGTLITLEGKLQQRMYTDKSGHKHQQSSIILKSFRVVNNA